MFLPPRFARRLRDAPLFGGAAPEPLKTLAGRGLGAPLRAIRLVFTRFALWRGFAPQAPRAYSYFSLNIHNDHYPNFCLNVKKKSVNATYLPCPSQPPPNFAQSEKICIFADVELCLSVMIKKTKLSWALQPVMNNRHGVVRSRAPQAVAAAAAEPKQEEAAKPAAPKKKEATKSSTNKK